MAEAPLTRPSLLLRLRDAGDQQAWEEFVDLYAPLVYGFARKHGLQDADAADLTQDVLRAVAGAVPRLDYDPARGSFRAWLLTVVRNKLLNFLAAAGRREQGRGDTDGQLLLERLPAPDEDSLLWEREHRQHILAQAGERVRRQVQPATWLAFWRTAVEGRRVEETAVELGLSVASVYLARSRVMARLKEQVRLLEERTQ
jgi:RNA polymerase sigma-70 factor (ECF subfamily)